MAHGPFRLSGVGLPPLAGRPRLRYTNVGRSGAGRVRTRDGATERRYARGRLTQDRQELAEETGLSAGDLIRIGEYNPYNGVTDELCRVYLARRLEAVKGMPDETEEFEVVALPPGEIDRRVSDGSIWDGMSIAACASARGVVLGE